MVSVQERKRRLELLRQKLAQRRTFRRPRTAKSFRQFQQEKRQRERQKKLLLEQQQQKKVYDFIGLTLFLHRYKKFDS